jgi:putative transcriptional regulator
MSTLKRKTYTSDAYAAIHQAASALQAVGVIDQQTMRDFDASCLVVTSSLPPKAIQQLRLRNRVSQPIFARYLNTSESTVQKWESGAKKPSGMALRLLQVVDRHGLDILREAP